MASTIEKTIYEKLTGDATLMNTITGVYDSIAPKSATYPLLVFQQITGIDDYTLTQRVSTAYRFQFKVIDKGWDKSDCRTAMDRLDALLTDGTLTVAGKTLWVMRRLSEESWPEIERVGVVYQSIMGDWAIELA